MFRLHELLHLATSMGIKITFLRSMKYSHIPWDPGGFDTRHRIIKCKAEIFFSDRVIYPYFIKRKGQKSGRNTDTKETRT